MTHCVMAMLVAVLLQPPTPPAKPEPGNKVTIESSGTIILNERNFLVENPKATHPDIRVAEARLMEAQAMLELAKLKVATDVAMNKAKYDQAKADVVAKTEALKRADIRQKAATIDSVEHAKVVDDLQAAKSQLAMAELLTQAAKEAAQAPIRAELSASSADMAAIWMQAAVGSPPGRSQPLQDLLQRKVKLSVKATDADNSVIGVLERCMKEWDFAAAKVIVRYPQVSKGAKTPPVLHEVEGENTVGVWLLLMLDEFNVQNDRLFETMRGKYQIYVREYGLLFTQVKNAPDGAPTLAEFLRQAKK